MELSPSSARLLASSVFVLEQEAGWGPGTEIVARVVAARAEGGPGLLSLAGRELRARLPAGLEEGQRLALRVEGPNADGELVLALNVPSTEQLEVAPARLAGALALRGDADLLRLALALAGPGQGLPLPGGGAVSVAVDPDQARDRDAGDARARTATVVLSLPVLGTVELRLRLDAAGVAAAVTLEPGRAALIAAGAEADLTARLARAIGAPATVELGERDPGLPPLRGPAPVGTFDGYA